MSFSRRKLFNALTLVGGAGVGMSLIAADRVVALTFDDQEYLNERAQRLTAHVDNLNKWDAERAENLLRTEAEQAIIDQYLDASRHAMALGQPHTNVMPMEHYDILCKNNLVDFIPNSEGKLLIPVLAGTAIKIV